MILRIWTVVVMALSMGCDSGPRQPAEPVVPSASPPPTPPAPPTPPPPPEGPLVTQPETPNGTVTVDATALRQEMQGFGTSMRIFTDPHLIGRNGGPENSLQISSAEEDAVLRVLYEKIGLTRVRPLALSRGTQPTLADTMRTVWVFADGHIDIVKRARSIGLREWWLSPLLLETWMDESNVADYVDWAMRAIRYWKTQGVELAWYSIVNEPGYPPIKASPEFFHDAVILLGRRLADEGFRTKLVIPDDVHPISAVPVIRSVMSDPEARKYVGALATHLYGYPVSTMKELTDLAEQYGVPLWMSEFSVADGSPLEWASLVHTLLSDYNVSAVDYMWGFFGDNDTSQLVSLHHSGGKYSGFSITSPGYEMAQYAAYVRPGARRVLVTSTADDVRVSAFVLNGRVTIVALNSGQSDQPVKFSVSGVSGLEKLRVVRTSAKEQLASVGHLVVSGGSFNLTVPARSISTLIQ
ncbi:MAG TPA: glycoside hydrolase family 30 beta sandwich domain-containing protein [Gemmatimonadaceae bacterium]|nr:glycoside hydrolase family 30 beta sandwich domain-containing protein [Gemmatimonadaceae bacterium]